MEQPPGGDPGNVEKGPYDKATLDAEIAAYLASRGYKSLGPEKDFSRFQNNFYGRLPGGFGRVIVEDLKAITGDSPGHAADIIKSGDKKHEDVDSVLEEIGADPELVARAVRLENLLDPAVNALLRKVYIGMRNRGYTFAELFA